MSPLEPPIFLINLPTVYVNPFSPGDQISNLLFEKDSIFFLMC